MPKILAIDDINDNLISLKAIIRDAMPEATVLTALNGSEGIELAVGNDPDVILLDILMPGMDGFEVCRRLKKDQRVQDIPVVFVTAIKGDKESRIKAIDAGAEGFLAKPIDEIELIAQISAMAKIKEAVKQKANENERLKTLIEERTRKIAESEAQFREFFNKASDAIFVAEIESGIIVDANEAASRLTLIPREKLIGMHQSQLHPPADENYTKETFNKHKQANNMIPVENRVVRSDGSLVPVEILASEVSYHGEKCLMGTFRDITERNAADEQLRKSEEKYRKMVNLMPDAVIIHDNGKIVFANSSTNNLVGATSTEQLLGKSVIDFVHPDSRDLAYERITKIYETGEPSGFTEEKFITLDNTVLDGEVIGIPVSYMGRPAIQSIVRNITERKKAEASLSESEMFFKESQRAAFIGSYKFDIVNDLWTSSEVLEQIFGIDKSYSRSLQGWIDLTHPDDREMISKYFAEEVVGKRSPFNKEYRILRKSDGETRWVLGVGKLNFDSNGNVIEMIGTIQDITARKRIEESLIETNEFSNSLLQTIPFGMDIVDEHGNILFQNEQMSEIFGGNTVGKKCWELYRDDKSQCINCPLLSGIKIGETEIYESRGVLGNKIFQISHTGMMFRGQKAMLEIFQDITGRKESEAALQESEERYRRFISQVSEGVYRFEVDEPMDVTMPVEEQIDYIYDRMAIAECNDAFVKMYGIEDEKELIGKSYLFFHGGRHSEFNREAIRNFISGGYRIENAVTEEFNSGGQKIYFRNNAIGIIENGHLVRMWGTQTDVTETMRAERVQHVLYSISNAALSSIDLSELIEFISKEIGKLLDSTNFYIAFYDEKTNMLSTIYERDEKDVLDSWPAEKSITGYVIRHQKSMRITYEDVQKLCDAGEIEIFGTPSKVWLGVPLIMNKKVIGALVVQSYDDPEAYTEQDKLMLEFISHQISISIERKKAEQELNEALVKAQESDRLKSAFLANMSHEIRTPLNSIIGFSELMCDPDFDFSQQFDFSRMINSSGNNLLGIITDIMDLSKIEAGQIIVRKELFSVNDLINDIQKEYSFMAGKKGIRLELDLSEIEGQLEIESDESALRKILINFVGNAIKFTNEGRIEIGVKPVGKYLQFHVKDTGIGIPSEFHKTIFERFRQIESFSTRKYGGNGLGLAISKSLVELLEGKIWMESESGVGSTFYFAVPLEDNNY